MIMDLVKRIMEIEAEVKKKFGLDSGIRKKVQLGTFSLSPGTAKKAGMKFGKPVAGYRTLTFSAKAVTPDGATIMRIARFVLDAKGRTVKKSFSR